MAKITISGSRQFLNLLTRIFYSVFYALGLRGKKRFWGVVYDSKTKQPLDPVIVKLIGAGETHEVHTCITDMEGRYGFLVDPGKYKILPKKSNYVFPSSRVTGSEDGNFKDVYHGEFFEVSGGAEVVAPNIPMDPLATDWNQQAKAKILHYKSFWKSFFSVLLSLAFWAGFSLTLFFIALDFKQDLVITQRNWFLAFCGYLFVFILNGIVPQTRLWGQVLDKNTGQAFSNLLLELKNPVLPDLFMARTQTTEEGRFFLRVNPGNYTLEIKKPNPEGVMEVLGRVKVSVTGEALVNQTLLIDLQNSI